MGFINFTWDLGLHVSLYSYYFLLCQEWWIKNLTSRYFPVFSLFTIVNFQNEGCQSSLSLSQGGLVYIVARYKCTLQILVVPRGLRDFVGFEMAPATRLPSAPIWAALLMEDALLGRNCVACNMRL